MLKKPPARLEVYEKYWLVEKMSNLVWTWDYHAGFEIRDISCH